MKRRTFISAFLLTALLAAPLHAQSADIIAKQLRDEGFTSVSMRKTWLGRIRIVASNDAFSREIVIDPRTGEILRDVWENLGSGQFGAGFYDPDDEDSNYERSGGRHDDDDDDDDDDNDDDDDDKDDDDDDD